MTADVSWLYAAWIWCRVSARSTAQGSGRGCLVKGAEKMEQKAIRRGDMFWVDIVPGVGSVIQGRRPAVIVSNDLNNQHADTREVVYLTRNTGKKSMPTHTFVICGDRVSLAICEQISTVSVSQLGKFIGRCNEKEMYRIDRCLATSIGLHPGAADLVLPREQAFQNHEAEIKRLQTVADTYKYLWFQAMDELVRAAERSC